jgi:hypothetical protein
MVDWQSATNSDTYWTGQYKRLFVAGESALVQTSLRNDFNASVTQFFSFATASLSADVFVGNTHDVVLTFDLSCQFLRTTRSPLSRPWSLGRAASIYTPARWPLPRG